MPSARATALAATSTTSAAPRPPTRLAIAPIATTAAALISREPTISAFMSDPNRRYGTASR